MVGLYGRPNGANNNELGCWWLQRWTWVRFIHGLCWVALGPDYYFFSKSLLHAVERPHIFMPGEKFHQIFPVMTGKTPPHSLFPRWPFSHSLVWPWYIDIHCWILVLICLFGVVRVLSVRKMSGWVGLAVKKVGKVQQIRPMSVSALAEVCAVHTD